MGGFLVGGASGMKDIRVPRSVQNVKRQKIFTDERRIKIKIQREELCCRQEKKRTDRRKRNKFRSVSGGGGAQQG